MGHIKTRERLESRGRGAAGKDGLQGKEGAKGPTGTAGAAGATGATGPTGPEGSPWTVNSELAAGARLTGTWAFNATEDDTEVIAPISFPIRLQVELGEDEVHFQGQGNFATTCKGSD